MAKSKYKAIVKVYVCGKWREPGEVFTLPDCQACIEKVLKSGKVVKA